MNSKEGRLPNMDTLDLSVPWEQQDSNQISDAQSSPSEDLRIYEKARHFGALTLVSGSTLKGDIEEYISGRYGMEGLQRYKVAKTIMKKLGYRTAPDVLLAIACNKPSKIIVATAGAGKTTTLQLDLLVSKMLDVATGTHKLDPVPVGNNGFVLPKILYLNYNQHNTQPILQKHKSMCASVNKLIKDPIDDSIESSTVHSFCHRWLNVYKDKFGLDEITVASDETIKSIWLSIMEQRVKKFYGTSDVDIDYNILNHLYTIKEESMQDWDEFRESSEFVDTELNFDFTKACIKKYASMKKLMRVIDFTDYLTMMVQLLRENPDVKEEILKNYEIIIADEAQDFTALMNTLLVELNSPWIKRIVVGDPDQTIYKFRGVSPDNIVTLYETIGECDLLGLDTNYRCGDVIVDAAKNILDLNILRFEKPINAARSGGRIFPIPCEGHNKQIDYVVSRLKLMSEAERASTVVCYRNNSSSVELAERLYYEGIPFNIVGTQRPFNNIIFKSISNILWALHDKKDRDSNISLYKVLPYSKTAWVEVLNSELNDDSRNILNTKLPARRPESATKALDNLKFIAQRIHTAGCNEYIGYIMSMFKTYYFNFIQSQNPDKEHEYDSMFLSTLNFFNRPCTFETLMSELAQKNVNSSYGVTLSTFHALKGLEFDTVFAIDFNDSIFPDYAKLDMTYSPNTAMEEKESENRLCYVLVTRAIKELYLVYDSDDPSVYVNILLKDYEEKSKTGDVNPLDLSPTLSSLSANSNMSFIQKMTLRGGGGK